MTNEAKLSGYNLFSDDLTKRVQDAFKVYKLDDLRVAWLTRRGWDKMIPKFLDDEYHCIPFPLFKEVMKASRTNRFLYEKYFDCDKFSRQFQAEIQTLELNSVGMVIDYSARHSYNVVAVIGDDQKVDYHFIEPQQDREIKIHQSIYTFENGEVIF